MALNADVVESVTSTNFKVNAEADTISSSDHRNRLRILSESALGMMINRMNSMDMLEALSLKQASTGNVVAETMANVGTAVASIQQLVKAAQTTPPVTHGVQQ